MQEQLRLISEKPFTAVVAPMGYGKSTAINRYLNNLDKRNNKVIRIKTFKYLEKNSYEKELEKQLEDNVEETFFKDKL